MGTALKVSDQTESISELINDRDFDDLRKLVYDQFGITLSARKKTLVVGRLAKVLRQRGFDTFKAYYSWVVNDPTGEGLEELANRISTNHTFFWRENTHFQYFLDQALPEIEASKSGCQDKKIRIWCAGCSSGEEPYTLIMLMKEYFGNKYSQYDPTLLATDISQTALKKAMTGIYEADRVAELPPKMKHAYFDRNRSGLFAVMPTVKQHIIFRRHNLVTSRFRFRNQFDAIFCRNVMIYFDRETRRVLIDKFYQNTMPGGYLFIGHSETVDRKTTDYQYVLPALYRKGK